jgi:hypothetical protein
VLFSLAEEEWGKILLELGPLLGIAFIVFRIVLTAWLGLCAWRALRQHHDALPLLIFASTAQAVVQGQWAPPTVLGFAVLGSGLLLGALNRVPERSSDDVVTAPTEAPVRPRSHGRWPVPSVRRLPAVPRHPQK